MVLERGIILILAVLYVRSLTGLFHAPPKIQEDSIIILNLILLFSCFILPIARVPALSLQKLEIYPLRRRELLFYCLVDPWLNGKSLFLFFAIVAMVLVLFSTTHSFLYAGQTVIFLFLSSVLGSVISAGLTLWHKVRLSKRRYLKSMKVHNLWLLRRELSGILHLCDFYLAVAIGGFFAYTQVLGCWVTPSKGSIPFLVVALFFLSPLLNPLAMDTPEECDRLRLLPTSFTEILENKHLSIGICYLIACSSLLLAYGWTLPFMQVLLAVGQAVSVFLGAALSSLYLMHFEEAKIIQKGRDAVFF